MAKELKAKSYNFFPRHFFCRQCVKKYYNIVEGDQNRSDVENESDNDYSCEKPRKKFNTSLDTMVIFPVHLHGVVQHSRTWIAKYKNRAVEVLKISLSNTYVVSIDQLVSSESVNVIFETEQKSLIVYPIWQKRSWLPLHTLKRYKFWHFHQILGPVDTVQNILMFQNT